MSFRLTYRDHQLDLPPGRFVVGRSPSAQLSLDDGLVSRQHAVLTVTPVSVIVEDLGSRNGTLVNGTRIQGAVQLAAGDRIKIGSQEMVLEDVVRRARPEASTRAAVTVKFERLGVVGELAQKAIALGRGDEAERLVGPALLDVLVELESGGAAEPELVAKAVGLAMGLAKLTGKGAWVDYVVRLHRRLCVPLPVDVVDALHDLLRKVSAIDRSAFKAYVAELRNRADLSPAERFLVSRIEGLERMASLR